MTKGHSEPRSGEESRLIVHETFAEFILTKEGLRVTDESRVQSPP